MRNLLYLADSDRLKYKSRLQAGVLTVFFLYVACAGLVVLVAGHPLSRGESCFFAACLLAGSVLACRAALMRVEVSGDHLVFHEFRTRRIPIRDIAEVGMSATNIKVIRRDGHTYVSGAIVCPTTLVERAASDLNAAARRINAAGQGSTSPARMA